MGWGYYIGGDMELPEERVGEWRGLLVDPDAFSDWPGSFEEPGEAPRTVGELLELFERFNRTTDFDFVDVVVQGSHVSLRAALDRSNFGPWTRELMTLFRVAAPLGARGELMMFGDATAPRWGYRVRVGDNRSRVSKLPTKDARPLFDEIERIIEKRPKPALQEAPIRPPPPTELTRDNLVVAYRGSLEKQSLDVRVKTKGKPPYGTTPSVLVLTAANEGLAGSDDFHPATGRVKILSGPAGDARGPSFVWKMDVTGVSPRFLPILIQSLSVTSFLTPVVSMSIVGSLKLDDTSLSVRENEVLTWLATRYKDVAHYPKAWPKPSLPIDRIDSPRGGSIRLRLAGGVVTKAMAGRFFKYLGAWGYSVHWYPNRGMNGPGSMEYLVEHSKTELTARFETFDYVPGPTGDMLVNLIERFHTKVAPLAEATIALPAD